MTVTYSFVPVPLDAASPADAPAAFGMSLLATFAFAEGSVSGAGIEAAVNDHPLLRRTADQPLRALAMRYQDWINGPRSMSAGMAGVRSLTLRYRGTQEFVNLRSALLDYLRRSGNVGVAGLGHDGGHDLRGESDFVDIAGTHDRITQLRGLLHDGIAGRLGLVAVDRHDDLSDQAVSYAKKRWVEGQVQSNLIDLVFRDGDISDKGLGPEAARVIASLRRDVAALARRHPVGGRRADRVREGLWRVSPGGEGEVSPEDPNAAVHAALTNGIIAKACGIVTEWSAEGTEPLSDDLVIALDALSFPGGLQIDCRTTAFRRSQSTHPLCFRDIGNQATTNCGLALLNDERGGPRYSCTSINAETASIQATLLQANNSPSNGADVQALEPGASDNRPPVELAAEQFGYNELEGCGLTVSAPVDDLVTPDALKAPNRATTLPCLFLEDLWIGYRLDLAEGTGFLRSVHRQRQHITFTNSGRRLEDECEDFEPREAVNEDREVSTEILRFDGLSNAQKNDYARFLGTYRPPEPTPGAPFTYEVGASSGVTALRFGRTYNYRLRNVFQGGISHRDDDPGLRTAPARYVQGVPFLRARSFRAGELLIPPGSAAHDGKNPVSVYLTDRIRSRKIHVAPCPVDSDTARYNGQFLAGTDEPRGDRQRAFVTDLSNYMADDLDAPYYCDPDVSEIRVEAWVRNGDPASTDRAFMFEDGAYCEMIPPLHLGPVVARFGPQDRWREFRPIEITFRIGSGARPTLRVEGGGRHVRVTLPLGAEIELVLTPVVSAQRLALSAAVLPSSTFVALRRAGAAGTLPVVEHRLRAVHCAKRPMASPAIVSERNAAPQQSAPVAILKRERLSDVAEIVGYVQADAASTGQIQIKGAWSDIDDDPMHARMVLKAGMSMSRPRSLVFRPYSPPGPAVFSRRLGAAAAPAIARVVESIGSQCAENRVFLGGAAPARAAGDDTIPPCALALGDSRRRRVQLSVVGKGRYQEQFPAQPAGNFEYASAVLQGDVPASMELPVPLVSHVIPLIRQLDSRDQSRRARQRVYAFRIYVRRPWFVSGPGERLAIGCHAGPAPRGPRATLNKLYTQWGEDPVARSRAQASRDLPRAAGFRAADMSRPLDAVLYPPGSQEGTAEVLYMDDIVRDPVALDREDARLSLASFGLHWDDAQKLWYCDVALGNDFSGWIGLALYRHQPHAHEGLQLSSVACWVYSMVVHGERVTWLRQGDRMHVMIGPVFDRTASFMAEVRRYRDGVSDLREQPARRLPFREVLVEGRRYFEGYFSVPADSLEIIRRRFDDDVATFRLEG